MKGMALETHTLQPGILCKLEAVLACSNAESIFSVKAVERLLEAAAAQGSLLRHSQADSSASVPGRSGPGRGPKKQQKCFSALAPKLY